MLSKFAGAIKSWWSAVRLREPFLFILVSTIVFAVAGLIRYQILVSDYLTLEDPIGYYTLGGRAIILSIILLLTPLAIYRQGFSALLAFFLLIWWNWLDSLLVPGGIDPWKEVTEGSLGLLDAVQSFSQIALVLGLLIAAIFIIVEGVIAFAARLDEWIKNRSIELFGESAGEATGPRTVSLLAIFALIFSFLIPILGLALSYAARNDIAVGNGRKTGKDIAITATIISWFGLIVILVFATIFLVVVLLQLFLLNP